jgi:hypothetical protein
MYEMDLLSIPLNKNAISNNPSNSVAAHPEKIPLSPNGDIPLPQGG